MADNYKIKLEKLRKEGNFKPGEVSIGAIMHDDYCHKIKMGGECNCDPDITITPIPDDL